MNKNIHDSTIISPKAKIGKNVKIGPYCVIGEKVVIGDNCSFHSHCILDGNLIIGDSNKFFPFCSIGTDPQDLTYRNEDTKVVIGNGNTFREFVSIHKGTTKDFLVTNVGNNNLLMAYVHLGHDVQFGNGCTIANSCNFAGHVKVSNKVIIGGGSQISQFITIGEGAYIGGGSVIVQDIPPFCTGYGNRVKLKGVNIVGLRRQGHAKDKISEFVDFFRQIESSTYSPKSFMKHFDDLDTYYSENILVKNFVDFINTSEMGVTPFWS